MPSCLSFLRTRILTLVAPFHWYATETVLMLVVGEEKGYPISTWAGCCRVGIRIGPGSISSQNFYLRCRPMLDFSSIFFAYTFKMVNRRFQEIDSSSTLPGSEFSGPLDFVAVFILLFCSKTASVSLALPLGSCMRL